MGWKSYGRGGVWRQEDTRPRKIIGYYHRGQPIYGNERETHYYHPRSGVLTEYADTAIYDSKSKPVVTKDEPLGRDMVRQQASTRRTKVANRSGKRRLRT